MTCFECGAHALHQHHVIPRSLGGTQTVPLCEACHGKVHGKDLHISALTRAAQTRKRAHSEYVGGEPMYGYRRTPEGRQIELDQAEQALMATAQSLRRRGVSLRAIGASLESQGMLPRNGRRWHAETVKALLRGLEVLEQQYSPTPKGRARAGGEATRGGSA